MMHESNDTGVKKEGTYRGYDWEIHRTDESDAPGPYPYEFRLYIEGRQIETASGLEQHEDEKWTKPWIPALEAYAEQFINEEIHEEMAMMLESVHRSIVDVSNILAEEHDYPLLEEELDFAVDEIATVLEWIENEAKSES